MSLNRTGIEWVRNSDGTPGFTWNPIVGCSHGCAYCWAMRQARRAKNRCDRCFNFKPHIHHERLDDPLKRKMPSTIAVSLMGDLFCDQVRLVWIDKVFDTIKLASQHKFLLLTKNIRRVVWTPSNSLLGITCDGLIPTKDETDIWWLTREVDKKVKKFISFEPLLRSLDVGLKGIDWIIIGGMTGPTYYPPKEDVIPLIEQAKKLNIPVFMKPNLGPEYAGKLIQQFPEELWQK